MIHGQFLFQKSDGSILCPIRTIEVVDPDIFDGDASTWTSFR